MKLFKQFIILPILFTIFSCQMRSNNGIKTSDLENSGGIDLSRGGEGQSGDIINNTIVSDDKALQLACGIYEEQKKRDDWFNTHNLYDSCGYDKGTFNFNGEVIPTGGTSVECVNPNVQAHATSDFCGFFGDHNEAQFVELKISIKFNLTYKAIIIIQNGVIKIEPHYKWFQGNLIDDEALGGYYEGLVGIGIASGLLELTPTPNTVNRLTAVNTYNLSKFREKHFVGTIPGYCNDDNANSTGMPNANGPNAKVTINGAEYSWHMVGFTPFRIPEFSNQYVFSGDCINKNTTTDADENTNVDIKGAVYNNFVNPIHLIEVTNESVNMQKNTGCREVAVNFTLGYYKTKSTEYEQLEYSNAELEESCKNLTLQRVASETPIE